MAAVARIPVLGVITVDPFMSQLLGFTPEFNVAFDAADVGYFFLLFLHGEGAHRDTQ